MVKTRWLIVRNTAAEKSPNNELVFHSDHVEEKRGKVISTRRIRGTQRPFSVENLFGEANIADQYEQSFFTSE